MFLLKTVPASSLQLQFSINFVFKERPVTGTYSQRSQIWMQSLYCYVEVSSEMQPRLELRGGKETRGLG